MNNLLLGIAVTLLLLMVGIVLYVQTGYRTPDGRCWQWMVPSGGIEQPANAKQRAVKPVYAINVECR